MEVKRPPKAMTQCAGQGCPDRKKCLRFRLRKPMAPWASFDIDRQRLGGDCPAMMDPK